MRAAREAGSNLFAVQPRQQPGGERHGETKDAREITQRSAAALRVADLALLKSLQTRAAVSEGSQHGLERRRRAECDAAPAPRPSLPRHA